VIQHDDMVDQLLDAKRYPAWQGERIAMVKSWSDRHEDLWLGRYRELRVTFDKDVPGDQARAWAEADAEYRANRAVMDAGCVVSWESCYDPEREQSAIQHAYNAFIDDGPDVFASEFQNQPLRQEAQTNAITSDDCRKNVIEIAPWIVPGGLDTLTGFIDVQEKALYWAVVAWGHQFRGHMVAYGTWPEQNRSYYTLRDIRRTMQKVTGLASLEAATMQALTEVATLLLDREFARETDDAVLRVAQVFVDANWDTTKGVVRDFARRSQWGPRVLPTHGRFVGASRQTLSDKRPDRGERVGSNWRTSTIQKQRHVLFDTNAWKTLVAARIKLPAADPQALTIHAGDHAMLVEHLAAEYPVRAEAQGRVVDEWQQMPGRDNHWFDCLVGAAVAASFAGVSSVGVDNGQRRRKKVEIPSAGGRRIEVRRMGA
jgi:phage terminase large subunit GpA-like protein